MVAYAGGFRSGKQSDRRFAGDEDLGDLMNDIFDWTEET
jgi:hypothetical protein